MGGIVFTTDWYKEFIGLQRNPKSFADRRKLTRDDLCMYMLKDLYSDTVNSQCKCHIMLLFQEHKSYLIENETMLEQVIGSLENLYNLYASGKDKLLRIHIIVTMTTLLLSWDIISELTNSLLLRLKDLLLTIIFSENKDRQLRSTACQCLTEMEDFFPGYLKEELGKLLSAVQNCQLVPVQSYVLLLSTCLRYKIDPVKKEYSGHSRLDSKSVQTPVGHSTFQMPANEVQVHHIITSIMDILPSMSTTSVYHVLNNLKHIVEGTPELLPSVFKLFLPKLMMSSDILQFHLAFDLLKTFEADLFSSQEEKLLLRQLLVNIKQPLLSNPHRLLYLDWLRTFLAKKDVLSIRIPPSCLEVLVPGPFDDALIQEKKISIICFYLQSFQETVQSAHFIISCLTGLKKQIFMKPLITTVSAFFRLLYCMFQTIDISLIQKDMQKLLVEVMSFSPYLSFFVLDFLKCIRKECKEKVFTDSVFSSLVNHIINLTPKQCSQDIDYFLPIFETVLMEAPHVSKPQVLLSQLKKVLSEANLLGPNTWEIGHDILSLCCIFLKHHDIEALYHDLGEVLNLVMNNIKNCDCQDRAKQYYAALTSLPQFRIKELFANQKLENKGNISLTTIVSGAEATFFSRNTKLEEPILELVCIERTSMRFPTVFEPDASYDIATLKTKYLDFLSSDNFQPIVKIPFLLKHVECSPQEFSTLYSVVITSTSNQEGQNISDIEVPVLRNSENSHGTCVEVEFTPKVLNNVVLHLQVLFTASSGSSYRFNLPPIRLELKDFFSLLPVKLSTEDSKQQLFDELWAENTRYVTKFHINTNSENLNALVEEHWKAFVVHKQTGVSYDIAIFLPPAAHFLMIVKSFNNAVLATIKTDKDVLPFVSWYMTGISSN